MDGAEALHCAGWAAGWAARGCCGRACQGGGAGGLGTLLAPGGVGGAAACQGMVAGADEADGQETGG